MLKRIAKLFGQFCVLAVLLVAGLVGYFYLTTPTIIFSDPNSAVIDARLLIDNYRKEPQREPGYLEILAPDKLPKSLQLPGLRTARLYNDHLELELDRNPDYDYGARIWSKDVTRQHGDAPTEYPEIFHYSYCHDCPKTETNIP